MGQSGPITPPRRRRTPWPDGKEPRSGLFEIVTVGISPKDHDIDFAINSDADDDLSPGNRARVVETLEALARHFRKPAWTPGEGE